MQRHDNKISVFIGGKQIGVNCLRILLARGITPKLVIANPDDTGRDTWHESLVKTAREAGLPVIVGKKVRDPDCVKKIKNLQPEIIFCIGAMQIIPKEVLSIPRLGCLNIHPALLPKYRGRFSTAHALFNGERWSGATLHWMDEGIDSGPIILQKKVRIEENDTAKTLYDKVLTGAGSKLFVQFLGLWLAGKTIPSSPQNEKEASYYPKGLPNNAEIDWSWDGRKINRFIRSMTFEPFRPPTFTIGDKKMIIVDEKQVRGLN
ncbi:MAG: methionyl-tRNA formyltransferase [Parcubacteria group bacterium Greene0714_36]|nr:MAG: methionyl-tRNA formyltransferase [Parcubacteria group bacterium Greene0714_36]